MNFWGLVKGLLIQQQDDRTKQLVIEVSGGASPNTKTTLYSEQTADRQIQLPDFDDRLVGTATPDTLTNKYIDAEGTGNLITNISDANIKSGAAIDAAKLADGSVSNAEYQYLNGVTSSIQTQLNDKAAAVDLTNHINDTSTHGVVGDIVGTTDTQTLTNKTLTSPVINTPTGITKSDVGLANVDNTSDATKNSATATLSNKTLDNTNLITVQDSNLLIQDNADATKQMNFQVSGVTAGVTRTLTVPDANTTIVGTDVAQTLTNKTLTSPSITTPSTDVITLDGQASAPANPSAGSYKAYVRDSDGKLAILNSAGVETVVGSGSGGINYITNGDAEVNTDGWITYKDAAQFAPENGTGGTPGTVTFTRSATSPLRGAGSFLFAGGGSSQGEGASYDFTIADEDKAKVLQIRIPYIVNSGIFVAGSSSAFSEVTVWIYDVSNSLLIQPSNIKLFSNSSTVSDIYTASFQTSSNSNNYRLIVHCSSNSLNSYVLKLDDISISPSEYVFGTPISDEFEYAPVISGFGTVTNNVAVWSRNGDKIKVRGSFTSGTSTATPARIGLPSLTIDVNKVGVDQRKTLGIFTGAIAGSNAMASTAIGPWIVTNDNDDLTSVALSISTNTGSNHYVVANGSGILASGQTLSYEFEAPIAGWSSSVQMSDSADTRVIAFRASGGNPASTTANNPIIFPTAAYDTHGGYNNATGRYTIPSFGYYRVHGALSTATAGTGINAYINGVNNLNLGFTDSNGECSYTGTVVCNAGDLLDVRPGAGIDADASSTMHIERISGPSAIAVSEQMRARYTSDVGQTISTGVTTIVDFEDKGYDTHNAVIIGASWKFTAQKATNCSVSATITYSASGNWAVNEKAFLYLYKNGSNYALLDIVDLQTTGTFVIQLYGSTDIDLLAGDYIDIRTVQSSGGSIALTTNSSENYVSLKCTSL